MSFLRMNECQFMGIVKSVEKKTIKNGTSKVSFSLTVDDGYKKDGEWVNKTEWHKLVFAIPSLADRAESIQKGDVIYTEGSISTNSWTTKEGEKKEYKEIACTMFKKMSNSKSSEKEYNQPKTTVTQKAEVNDDLPF